jgi:malate synthase
MLTNCTNRGVYKVDVVARTRQIGRRGATMNAATHFPQHVAFRCELSSEDRTVLTAAALQFVAELGRKFSGRISALLEARAHRQLEFDRGARPDFLVETRELRAAAWTVAAPPADLLDRRVEITGPVDRKMVINALNSGANAFMADFEDATTPTFKNLIQGQANLRDAVRRTISFVAEGGKTYELGPKPGALFVRPRGLHLPEKHVLVDGAAIPGALFDIGLYLFHNASELCVMGSGPYFYLPKLESHLEARLWNDVFAYSERALSLPPGSIRATVLIETLPAAFEMDEILFELRDRSVGLNCGRWDYIFSFIKKLRNDPNALTPDRAQITMDKGFLRSYAELSIQTCHRRGAHAMGGMAAQIPIKQDPDANRAALEKVRADKLREVSAGHDGTWVAHPALVPLAREIFDSKMKGPNQVGAPLSGKAVTRAELLAVPQGTRTLDGLKHNVRVGVGYLEAWLRGSGCVPLHHLMEDAATAEICRAQVWQWIRHGAKLDDGQVVSAAVVRSIVADETHALVASSRSKDAADHFAPASALFESLSLASEFEEFLTIPAYEAILTRGA